MVKLSIGDLDEILINRNLKYHSGFLSSGYAFNVECMSCHLVFSSNLYAKSRCRNCTTTQEFQYYIKIIEHLGFRYVSGIYQNKKSEILISHDICGYKFFTNIRRLVRGDGCARCSKKEKLSIQRISETISSRNIEILSADYENSHSKLIWRCGECGMVWKTSWDNIREGHGCPNCNKLLGEKNPRWRGGESKYPKEWNNSLKEFVRNRDRRRCQFPLCTYSDIQSKKLHVHHINGIKENCNPNNLISLCNSHHQWVETHDPKSWEDYFYAITKDYE